MHVQRNTGWARRIATLLADGKTRFANLGLNHVLGPDSIPEQLARAVEAQRAIASAAWDAYRAEREVERALLQGELDRVRRRTVRATRAHRESAAVLRQRGRLQRRALLVGINNYPQEADRLEGCVNDAYLMSSTLQECGFEPESIRVCFDDRATCQGIKERLRWLLDDPRPGDERAG